ncbi:MAG: alpha-amylase family glycosyl hydrolase [Bacteroidota bacterium]
MPDARYAPAPPVQIAHPEWTRTATLYQINTRQFTPEGTLAAARAHLPRLRDLGVGIVWLMPIHPIGEVNRKGTLGSPYAVRDYRAVNPEFGTMDDLEAFVTEAHRLGMRVILDWVANHTAWDHPWTEEHPDWYARDWNGDFRPTPWWDWSDVIDLDYAVPEVREAMTEAMLFWVREADVDGFRCDVAGMVPTDFWEEVRRQLDAVKPVFLLAEWEARDLHRAAFDASYAWTWYDAMHAICHGRADVNALYHYYSWNEKAYPHDILRMLFTSNHDKNAWDGTVHEQFGDGLEAAVVLSVISEGIPLVYNGQEADNRRRLAFFERDPINWSRGLSRLGALYRDLFALKRETSALHNAAWGARMVRVVNSDLAHVLSFVREDTEAKVLALFNLSAEAREVTLSDGPYVGEYRQPLGGDPVRLGTEARVALEPWGWRVLVAE